jgi:hypothetical protein
VASPEAFVTEVAVVEELIVPPPEAIAQFTVMPESGALLGFRTRTWGSVDKACPTVPVWLLPAWITRVLPETAVAVNVTDVGEHDEQLAVTVFVPAEVPSFQ